MANLAIDYDRGVVFQTHPSTGMNVYMYKSEPGKYINAYGSPLSEKIAQEAGFDTVKYGKEKLKRERMAVAMGAIERELEAVEDAKVEPVYELGGFKIMDIGLGRHNVIDPDGNQLNATPLSREIADILVKELNPKTEEAPKIKLKGKE